MTAEVRPTRVWQEDGRTLGLAWTDGTRSLVDVVALRRACPCAACAASPPEGVDDVRPERIVSVGRYGLSVTFDDGHASGVYTFPRVRALAAEREA